MKESPLIIALDVQTTAEATAVVDLIGDRVNFYKIGMELFTAEGPAVVEAVKARGKKVFLDLKYYDIPNTVRGAVESAAKLGVDVLTVHALGGRRMLKEAMKASLAFGEKRPKILAVTILTSFSDVVFHDVGAYDPGFTPSIHAERLAKFALKTMGEETRWEPGDGIVCDGVICSPVECAAIRTLVGSKPLIITPGVRLEGSKRQDQARVLTPGEAVNAGANYIVMGRSIIASEKPLETLGLVFSDIENANKSL